MEAIATGSGIREIARLRKRYGRGRPSADLRDWLLPGRQITLLVFCEMPFLAQRAPRPHQSRLALLGMRAGGHYCLSKTSIVFSDSLPGAQLTL